MRLAQDELPPPPPPPPDEPPPPPPPLEDEGIRNEPADEPQPPPPESGGGSSQRVDPGKDVQLDPAEKALFYKQVAPPPLTAKEKESYCKKYRNKFVSLHEDVYYVKEAKSKEVSCNKLFLTLEEASRLSRKGVHFIEVTPQILASFKEGGAYAVLEHQTLNCAVFNKNYVTFNLKTYWVENCKLKMFPDNASLQDHKWKNRFFVKPVIVLKEGQFNQFKHDKPFPSILDIDAANVTHKHEYKKIPMDKICPTLEGQFVSYLDSIYKIEGTGKSCYREKVDAEALSRRNPALFSKVRELTPSEALSIPEQVESDLKKK